MFEDWARNDVATTSRIVLAIKNFPVPKKGECIDFILNPNYFDNNPIGFFYGTAERGICGVGIVLNFNTQHFFKAHFDVGVGTNTKAELLGLWGLLSIANGCHIQDLMVVGDSRVVID